MWGTTPSSVRLLTDTFPPTGAKAGLFHALRVSQGDMTDCFEDSVGDPLTRLAPLATLPQKARFGGGALTRSGYGNRIWGKRSECPAVPTRRQSVFWGQFRMLLEPKPRSYALILS
jgi:hypothetical protein